MNDVVEVERPILKVCVLQPHLGDELDLMRHMGFEITNKPEEADVVVLTGGEDVTPHYYGESKLGLTHSSEARDEREWDVLNSLKPEAIKIGICRGAQFLCVYYGGKLWQHVDRHGGAEAGHWMQVVGEDYIKAVGTNKVDNINSYHHQALRILPSSWEIVGATAVSRTKLSSSVSACDQRDVEVAISLKDRVFAFQAHPEFRDNETRKVFYTMLEVFLTQLANHDLKNKKES